MILHVKMIEGECSAVREERAKQRKRLKAKSQVVRAEAQEKFDEAERALAILEQRLETAMLTLQFEEAQENLQAAYRAFREGRRLALEGGADRELTDRMASARLEELEGLRATVRLLEKRGKETTDELRTFVQARPSGWMHSDDPLKRYLAYHAPDRSILAFLKDNPRYSMTPDQLVALVGIAAATQYLTVAYGSFAKQVSDGLIRDTAGEVVTVERLEALRTRSVHAPSVEIRRPGEEQSIEELLDLIDPQYREGDGDDISVLGLDHGTEQALRSAEVHRVGQLRRSGDELTHISGIGPKRANHIHDALTRHRAA